MKAYISEQYKNTDMDTYTKQMKKGKQKKRKINLKVDI